MAKRADTTKTLSAETGLERLIKARLKPGADRKRIDEKVWELFGEEWAVMFTDLSGFSRRVAEFGIIHFLQTIYESERLLLPILRAHGGELLKSEGDSFLAIFTKAPRALNCAIAMQRRLKTYNARRPDEEKVLLCVGLGHGRMLRVGHADVFGPEVNAAGKLGEDTAKAGEILVTGAVRTLCPRLPGIGFAPLDQPPPGAREAYRVIFKS